VDAALQAARRRASGGGCDSEHGGSGAGIGPDGAAERRVSLRRSRSATDVVAPSVLAAHVCSGMLRRSASAASPDRSGGAKSLL
jgi:hypothetical protein